MKEYVLPATVPATLYSLHTGGDCTEQHIQIQAQPHTTPTASLNTVHEIQLRRYIKKVRQLIAFGAIAHLSDAVAANLSAHEKLRKFCRLAVAACSTLEVMAALGFRTIPKDDGSLCALGATKPFRALARES